MHFRLGFHDLPNEQGRMAVLLACRFSYQNASFQQELLPTLPALMYIQEAIN